MDKCKRKTCGYATDKCKNPFSKNYNKFLDDIFECKPQMLKECYGKEVLGKKCDVKNYTNGKQETIQCLECRRTWGC